MPPLARPHHRHFLTLPAQTAEVVAEPDVLVVGGGPAGLGAALGAAGVGAEVVLAERYGFLGGNATAALVMPLMSSFTQRGRPMHVDLSSSFASGPWPWRAGSGRCIQAVLETLSRCRRRDCSLGADRIRGAV